MTPRGELYGRPNSIIGKESIIGIIRTYANESWKVGIKMNIYRIMSGFYAKGGNYQAKKVDNSS
jgi:hypothetical protein